MASRKRRAPGASPRDQPQSNIQRTIYPQETPNMATEQYHHAWNDTPMEGAGDINAMFNDAPSMFDFAGALAGTGAQSNHSRIVSLDGMNDVTTPGEDTNTGQLVRRNPNQQLAARRNTPWGALNNNEQQPEWPPREDEDDQLEQKALVAKKEAQSRRKQIPPFVQKLSSFLDDNKNTNLIRWSDDGNSFIVLDEDEFARTLIPELFKHNNYASFVRQLNMYGFHKKVGLSDNSMKASELKAKAPSEYYNKYFKRGRPELLWLITKPKNPPAGPKRKREDDGKGDSDDDRKYVQDSGGGAGYAEDLDVRGGQEMAMIPRTEYQSLKREVSSLQQQQKIISNVLGSIRRQNDQLYQQATAFQTLHERHENSINAILTFLATFYNRSLEGNSGANLADLFGPAIPQQQQPHGNVVDVEDQEYPEKNYTKSPQMQQMQMQRPTRRSLLLPPPAAKDGTLKPDASRAATLSPSVLSSAASPSSKSTSRQSVFRSPGMGARSVSHSSGMGGTPTNSSTPHIRPKPDSPQTTQPLHPLPENDEIMSAIQNVNANAPPSVTQSPHFDLPAALANYTAQSNSHPLTPQQRTDVLSLMANNASAASPNSALAHNSNNAMVNPQPPAIPNLTHYHETQQQLDLIQKMTDQQSSRVANLTERLQPLSPSGNIPGLQEGANGYFGLGEPGQYDLDMDSFVNGGGDEVYFGGGEESANLNMDMHLGGQHINMGGVGQQEGMGVPHLNFDMEAPTQGGGAGYGGDGNVNGDLLGFDGARDEGGKVESLSSSATSPAVTVEDVDEDDRSRKSPKRRKK